MALIPSTPRVKEIKSPSGASIAGSMVKNARAKGQRAPKIPKPPGVRSRARVPKAPRAAKSYDPLSSPYSNQEQFNAAVKANTQSQYQPELDNISTEEGAENATTAQHQANNVAIYKQYTEQAEKAYQTAQTSMAQIAARQNSSTAAGQQALQAALSNTGVAGLSGVTNPNDFINEAAGLGNEGSQSLAAEQSGLTGEMAKDLANAPAAGLAEANAAEKARSTGVLGKLVGERKQVLARVPNLEAKTRAEMAKEEQERQANKLQSEIATKKFGLEAKTQQQNVGIEHEKIASSNRQHHEDALLKNQELAISSGFEAEKIKLDREKINASIRNAKTSEQRAAAEAAGKRFDHGLELMAGYLKENPKTEYRAGSLPAGTAPEPGKIEYRRDAQYLYNMLTKQGNLTAPEAFRLMGSSGNSYIEQFAARHEAIYNHHSKPSINKGRPISRLLQGGRRPNGTLPTLRK